MGQPPRPGFFLPVFPCDGQCTVSLVVKKLTETPSNQGLMGDNGRVFFDSKDPMQKKGAKIPGMVGFHWQCFFLE